MDDDEKTITEFEDRRYDAIVAGDFSRFAELAHPDLVYVHSSAGVDTLDSYREKIESGFYDYHRIDHPVHRIVVAGDTAYVLGEMHAEVTAGGTEKTLHNASLAVWTRTSDGWRLLTYQSTVIPAASS